MPVARSGQRQRGAGALTHETGAEPAIVATEDSLKESPLAKPNHRKKRPSNHIPRPPNAFILFRSHFIHSQRVSQTVEASHSTLSKIIGITWQNLPENERAEWHGKAKRALDEHRRKYPQYAFRPQHSKKGGGVDGGGVAVGTGSVKRKVRDIEPRDNKRCAKIAELLIQGKKGDELDAAILEYDKHHVPTIVTRFEEPLTAEEYRSSSSPARSVSVASDDDGFAPQSSATTSSVLRSPSSTLCSSPRSIAGQSPSPFLFDDSYTQTPSSPSSSPPSHTLSWDPLSFCSGPPPPISAPPTFASSSYYHDTLAMPTPRRNLSIDTAFLTASGWSLPHTTPSPISSTSIPCQSFADNTLNGGPYDFDFDRAYPDQYASNINPFDIPHPEHQSHYHHLNLPSPHSMPSHNDILFNNHQSWEPLVNVGDVSYIHDIHVSSPLNSISSVAQISPDLS